MGPGAVQASSGGPARALACFGIAFVLAVGVTLAAPVLREATPLVTMFTPALAVAVMLVFLAPEGGLRIAFGRLGLDRAGLRGWPLAIAVPVLIHLVALAILVGTGLAVLAAPDVAGPAALLPIKIVVGLALGTVFALAEEVGWRGYMLPRMAAIGLLPAMLLVGLLHGVWHLPLMLGTGYYHPDGNPWIVVPLFLATLTLAGVFYGYLRVWTGSVWPVAVAHATVNAAATFAAQVARGETALVTEYVGGESGLVVIAGLGVLTLLIVRRMRRATVDPAQPLS